MFDISYEFGEIEGLGVIPGKVIKIPSLGTIKIKHKIPHIGWNKLEFVNNSMNNSILNGQDQSTVYFVHSYMAICKNDENLLAKTIYNGIDIASVVYKENSFGCQFHPERSGEHGLNILKEFLNL